MDVAVYLSAFLESQLSWGPLDIRGSRWLFIIPRPCKASLGPSTSAIEHIKSFIYEHVLAYIPWEFGSGWSRIHTDAKY